MSLAHALTFIKRAMAETSLRDRLNRASCSTEMTEVLTSEGLSFTPFEFEDALNSQLVKCSEWEAAEQLNEFKMWWEMLQQIVSPSTCASTKSCSGGCCG